MSLAAYATLIYSVGASVPVVGEVTTDLGANQYQVTDAARRLWHPDTPVAAYDDNGEVIITAIDYFNGTVTLSEAPTGLIDINMAYVTKAVIGGTKDYSFEIGGDVLEDTSFATAQANGGYKTRAYGLHDVTVSLSRYDDLNDKFGEHKASRERVYIEVRPGGGSLALKGWFVVETDGKSGDLGALEEEALTFNLASIGSQQDGVGTVFSFA